MRLWQLSVNMVVPRCAHCVVIFDGVTRWLCHLWLLLSPPLWSTCWESVVTRPQGRPEPWPVPRIMSPQGWRLNWGNFKVPSAQNKSHYISSHPFGLASNDAVMKVPLALPVAMLLLWFLLLSFQCLFLGSQVSGVVWLFISQEHIHSWDKNIAMLLLSPVNGEWWLWSQHPVSLRMGEEIHNSL